MNIAKHSFRAFCSVARTKATSTAIPITISSPANPRPSPVDVTSHHPKAGSKEFTNPWPSFQRSGNFFTFLKARFFTNDLKHPVVPENVAELIGTLNPSWETGNKNNIKAVWLGHACFYVELPCQPEQERGLRILFDPSLSIRCSPFSFAGPERITAAPISVDKLPELDLICFSHNHYDHLDIATLKALNQRYGDSVHYFVPLALSPFFNNLKISNVTELDWWEEKVIKKNDWEARLDFLPAQHFTGRTLWDSAHTLWGSFSIESTAHPEKNVWFAGDTGRRSIPKELEMRLPESKEEIDKLPVCPAHKQIGDLRGPFAFGMIPIGAYKPRFFMSPVHVDPEEAIELYKESRVQTAAAMHWGAWTLSSEETLEPKNELERLCKEQGIDGFNAWKIGERREI